MYGVLLCFVGVVQVAYGLTDCAIPVPKDYCCFESNIYQKEDKVYTSDSCYSGICRDGLVAWPFVTDCEHSKGVCFVDNRYYPPGATIHVSYNSFITYCIVTYCKKGGRLVSKRRPCKKALQQNKVIGPGCMFKGKHYDPKKLIYSNRDVDYCYGATCDENSKIVYWDSLTCSQMDLV